MGGGVEIAADARAQSLLRIMDRFELQQNLPCGTITFDSTSLTGTTLDLSFTTPELSERILVCQRRDDFCHDSNHWPVETTPDIELEAAPTKER